MDRLDQLINLEKESPQDPFIKYGIALELIKNEDGRAVAYFEELLEKFPDYLPTYYHATQYYLKRGNEIAKRIVADGIALAKKQNDAHTESELMMLQNQLNNSDEDEDIYDEW